MAYEELRDRLRGVFGFPLTPFREDLSLDLDALAANVDWMTGYPFCAQVAAGGTGELYSLTPDEIVDVVKVSVDAVNGRMPVVAGVGYNVPIATSLARRLEDAGADALLVLPPYYENAPKQGLFNYYKAIGEATGLPLMVYSRGWAVFTPDMVAELADLVPTLVFWKDGQGNGRVYQRIMNKLGDRLTWFGGLGDDCVPTYFSVGVQAYTSSISNIAPKLSLALAELGMKGDFKALAELMNRYVHPLYAIRERTKGYEVSIMKSAMEMLGLKAGPVRPPLQNASDKDIEDTRALLETYGEYLPEGISVAARV